MKSTANAILKVYLGAREDGGYQPTGGVERVEAAFPGNCKERLVKIEKYLNEDHPSAKWTEPDLAKEQTSFEKILGNKFPELDHIAIYALACRWSYRWK